MNDQHLESTPCQLLLFLIQFRNQNNFLPSFDTKRRESIKNNFEACASVRYNLLTFPEIPPLLNYYSYKLRYY